MDVRETVIVGKNNCKNNSKRNKCAFKLNFKKNYLKMITIKKQHLYNMRGNVLIWQLCHNVS